jgi:hypothetical protein
VKRIPVGKRLVASIVAVVLLYLSAKFDQFWLVPAAFVAVLLIYIVPGVIEGFRGGSKH